MLNVTLNHFKNQLANQRPPTRMDDVRTEDDDTFLEQSKPILKRLENVRMMKLGDYNFRKKIGIPGAIVLGSACALLDYMLLLMQSGSDDSFAGITFLVLGAIYWWVTKPKREYARSYKTSILPGIAKLFGNLHYNIDNRTDMVEMMPSKIVPHHDKYKSEDHFYGEYKGVTLEFSEIHLKQRRGSGKNRRYVTVFKGLSILLNTNHKRFYGHTIINRNASKITEWFKEKSSKLERAEMVDPEFEDLFDAYTNDQVEARYLIDPLMIEKLKDLYDQYHGKGMSAAFYDNKMLILVNSPYNHFEPADIHASSYDETSLLTMKREVGDILSIIDKLSLYDPKEVHALKQEQVQEELTKAPKHDSL